MQKSLNTGDTAPKRPRARGNPALRWNAIRQVHVYLSVFVAPSLIFFAVTGAFQTFRIPDRPDAPVVLQKLARAHKDSVFAVKPPKPNKPGGDAERAAKAKADEPAKAAPKPAPKPALKPAPKPAIEAVKWFFVLVAVVVALTALLGVWMALAYHKRRRLMWGLLIAGTLIPAALLAATV